MAVENEEVKYSFEGDVGSLRGAVTQAIGLLDKYSGAIKRTASSADFSASKSSINAFSSAVRSTISSTNALVKALNSLDASGLQQMAQYSSALASAGDTLSTVFEFLDQGAITTSGDFKDLTTFLRDAKDTIGDLAGRASGLATNFQPLSTLAEQSGTAVQRQSSMVVEAFNQDTEAAKRYVNQVMAQDAASVVEAQANRVVKSAKDSAAAFIEASTASAKAKANLQFGEGLSSMVGKIEEFRGKLTMLGSVIADKFSGISSAASDKLLPVTQILAAVSQAFRRAGDGADDAEDSVEAEGDAEEEAGKKTDKNTKAHSSLSGVMSTLQSATSKLKAKFDNLKSSMSKLEGISKKVGTALLSIANIQLGNVLADAAKSAIDFVESENLFNVAMGKSVDTAQAYIDRMSEIYGMDPKSLMDSAGVFYLMTDAINAPAAASEKMALSLTKAANDIASLYNVDVAQVTDNLQSGMQGMSKAVRKYGFDIRATTLQQTAYNYGLTQNVQNMSEANRQALRYITMMEQMRKSTQQLGQDVNGNTIIMGDFANTIESPANQLRIFKEQIAQLGRAIGNFLVAPLAKVIAYINGFVMAIRVAINFLSSLLGVLDIFGSYGTSKAAEDTADAVEGIGDAAGGAAKDMAKLLAPFDELNILQENQDSGGGGGGGSMDELLDPALLKAIEDMELQLENIEMKANRVRDALLNAFGFTYNADGEIIWSKDLFKKSLEKMFPEWTDTIEDAFSNWNLASVGQIAGVVVSGSLGKFADFISWDNIGSKVQEVVTKFTTILNAFFSTINGEDIGRSVGETINTISQTAASFFNQTDWDTIGVKLGDAITALFDSIDWEVLGKNLVNGPVRLLKILGNAFSTADWALVSQSLVTGITTAINTLLTTITTYGPTIIEGAFSIVTNLMLGFAQALPGLITNFVGMIQTLAISILEQLPLFVSAAIELVGSLGIGLVQALPTLVDTVVEIIMSVLHTLLASIPQLIDTVISIVDALLDNLPDIILTIVDGIGQIIGGVLAAIIAAIPDLIRAGIQLLTSLIGALPEIIVTIVAALPQIIVSIVDGFTQNMDVIATAGFELITALIAALPEIIGTIITAVPEIVLGLVDAFAGMWEQIKDAGYNLITGLWDGILAAKDWLVEKVSGWASGFIDDVKGFFGIASPSKEFATLGDYIVQGFANGITDNTQGTDEATAALFNTIMDQATDCADSFDTVLQHITDRIGKFGTDTLKSTTEISKQITDMFKGLWSTILTDTDSFAKQLQIRLNRMVAAAKQAASQIESAVSSAAGAQANLTTTSTVTVATNSVRAMATGGVVMSPTYALVGEAGRSEAVIPLDDSPQMKDLINKIADATQGSSNKDAPVEVKVYIGQDEFDAYTYKASKRGQQKVGAQPIKIGG